ncbi:MAG: pyrC2 [Rhodoglobus sp.]|nr:pyrC2 [Rhodoglobus sp.]
MDGVKVIDDHTVIIENVRIIDGTERVDVTVHEGRIARIEPALSSAESERVVLPGFVDLHTHLREPGGEVSETIATGTRAAAAGGYVDVFAMANTTPVTDTLERVLAMRELARDAHARVHVVAAATIGQADQTLVDISALRNGGVTLFSDDGHCVNDEGLVHELLQRLAQSGGVFAQHAQSQRIVQKGVINARVADLVGCHGWPEAGEEAIVARDIAIARATGGHLHVCHVSTKRSVDLIRWAKSVHAPVTAEVTPHHLALSDEDAVKRGPALKVNPPLRSLGDVSALREALADGTIDVVATDHAPHPEATKSKSWRDAAFGMTAIETALPVVAEVLTTAGRTSWSRVAEVMSVAPARIGGLRRESITVGSSADLCVIESGPEYQLSVDDHHSRSRNSPFAGYSVRHRVILTMLEGRITHS